jgi:hypothetical protein
MWIVEVLSLTGKNLLNEQLYVERERPAYLVEDVSLSAFWYIYMEMQEGCQ